MRKKQVWRYYCEFCKKSGCSGYHMKNHELHCTMNPERECRMCYLIDECGVEQSAPDLNDLKALLPNDPQSLIVRNSNLLDGDDYSKLYEAISLAMPRLRELSRNCPACILAAIRQNKIEVSLVEGFDFKRESEIIRSEYYEYKNADAYEYAD